jgi:hypothetical protein
MRQLPVIGSLYALMELFNTDITAKPVKITKLFAHHIFSYLKVPPKA